MHYPFIQADYVDIVVGGMTPTDILYLTFRIIRITTIASNNVARGIVIKWFDRHSSHLVVTKVWHLNPFLIGIFIVNRRYVPRFAPFVRKGHH